MADEGKVADDVLDFDPTKKKKKKKKPTAEVNDEEEELVAETEKVTIDDAPLDVLNFGTKKKKKKKKTLDDDDDEDEDGGDEEAEKKEKKEKKKKEKKEKKEKKDKEEGGDEDDELDFSSKKKKKKKKKATEEMDVDGVDFGVQDSWVGTDRDYSYQELLDRVFGMLREKNPEFGEKKRHVMKPPQVVREGTKKTVFFNFAEICKLMHRNAEHVFAYFLAELGTDGSIDGQQRLVLKGRYNPKQIESLLRKYIAEYVTCQMCKNPETVLTRDNVTRLYFLQCENCGSKRSVAPIKAGFHAQIGRRKKT